MTSATAYRSTLMLVQLSVITACSAPAQQRAAENAAIKKQAAQEVERICALPDAEREAELKKFREESGMDLYCVQK